MNGLEFACFHKGKIVVFKPAGKLLWPAEVVSEREGDLTVQIFNKNRSVKIYIVKIITTKIYLPLLGYWVFGHGYSIPQ